MTFPRPLLFSAFALSLGLTSLSAAQAQLDLIGQQDLEVQSLESAIPDVGILREGGRISRIYGVPFSTGETSADSAQAFIDRYPNIFGGGVATYTLEGEQDVMNGKFTAVYFKQVVQGVPVDLGGVTLLVKNERGFPSVLAVNSSERVPTIITKPLQTEEMALEVIAKANPRLQFFSRPELVIHGGEGSPRLAWQFEAESPSLSQPEKYKAFVDAVTGEIIEWRDLICYVDVTGSVKGYATPGLHPDQANNPAALTNLFGARLTITGVSTTHTNASGNFTLTNPGSAAVTVSSTLEGQWVKVNNSSGTVLSFSNSVTPPGPINFVYNSTPAVQSTSQVNGLIHTTVVHDFVKSISLTYPGVDIQMPCNVNVAGQANAFYNGTSINFYNAGGGYPNMCYSTVVYHEYGHHIVNVAGTSQGGYGEGMGDVTSVLLTGSNELGLDFAGQGAGPLRNAINTISYPCSLPIHTQGQIMSGSFWNTLQALIASEGSSNAMSILRPLWLNSILVQPPYISRAITIDVLTLDDNDSNLNNGTPHYEEIAAGFDAKGMTAPAVNRLNMSAATLPPQIVTPAPTLLNTKSRLTFAVNVTNNLETVNPNAVRLRYAIGTGAYSTANMVPIGGNQYRASLPTPSPGQSMRYFVEATTQQGNYFAGPVGTATEFKSLVVGKKVTTIFTDTFDTNLGWTFANSTSLTTGAWERGDPNGTVFNGAPSNPESDSNDAGTFCLFTDQGAVGEAAGTTDVDGGPAYAYSPTINMSGGNAILEFSHWFYNSIGDDCVNVWISNDNGSTYIPIFGQIQTPTSNSWNRTSIVLGNHIALTNQMKIRVTTFDTATASITEAAIDNVVVKQVK
ncbi:MAG: hypothetical protein JNK63_03320 [Chthonomonas sp.]|nr:hypothetical protein [Chthonomonas sp.]